MTPARCPVLPVGRGAQPWLDVVMGARSVPVAVSMNRRRPHSAADAMAQDTEVSALPVGGQPAARGDGGPQLRPRTPLADRCRTERRRSQPSWSASDAATPHPSDPHGHPHASAAWPRVGVHTNAQHAGVDERVVDHRRRMACRRYRDEVPSPRQGSDCVKKPTMQSRCLVAPDHVALVDAFDHRLVEQHPRRELWTARAASSDELPAPDGPLTTRTWPPSRPSNGGCR